MTHFHDHLKEVATHILFRSAKEVKYDYDYAMKDFVETADGVRRNINKTADSYRNQLKTLLEEINFRLAVEAEKKGTTHTNFVIEDINTEKFKYDND